MPGDGSRGPRYAVASQPEKGGFDTGVPAGRMPAPHPPRRDSAPRSYALSRASITAPFWVPSRLARYASATVAAGRLGP